LGGFWWRSVVHKLDVRWNEKCAINREMSLQEVQFQAERNTSTSHAMDTDLYEWDSPGIDVSQIFLDPGQRAPTELTAEFFSDGSHKPGSAKAGWGVWVAHLDSVTGMVSSVTEACGPVVVSAQSDSSMSDDAQTPSASIGAEHASNMTAELSALFKVFEEIQKLPCNAKCLVRFDCIPAAMMAVGVYKSKTNQRLVSRVHLKWLEVSCSHRVVFMHAKGHSGIHGNVRADTLADKGTHRTNDLFVYRAVADLGGPARVAQFYSPADVGRDCDLERKYAGKKRAKKLQIFSKANESRLDMIRKQLRNIGLSANTTGRLLSEINAAKAAGFDEQE